MREHETEHLRVEILENCRVKPKGKATSKGRPFGKTMKTLAK